MTLSSFLRAAAPALVLGALSASACQAQDAPLAPGVKAPNFTAKSLAGKTVSLKSLRGKVVLVDFWATWCGPCKMATPTLVALNKEFQKKGLVVIGMSVDDASSVDNVPSFARDQGISYTVTTGKDANQPTAQAYNVSGIPAQFLIDKNGVVRWSQTGYDPDERAALEARIKKLLKEK